MKSVINEIEIVTGKTNKNYSFQLFNNSVA